MIEALASLATLALMAAALRYLWSHRSYTPDETNFAGADEGGCICPLASERACQNSLCPRKRRNVVYRKGGNA